MINVYSATFAQNWMAMPVIHGVKKSDSVNVFAGADETYTVLKL